MGAIRMILTVFAVTLFCASPAFAAQCWPELDTDGATRTYCGSEEQRVCGLYAQWAYWACERGYGEHVGWCDEAADEAVEVCGEW